MKLWEAQAAVVAVLKNDSGVAALVSSRVYDDVPQDAVFPYVAIGDVTAIPFDTATTVGDEQSIDVHVWSRYRGRKETKQIQGAIYSALNRSTLAGLPGLVSCEQSVANDFVDADGITRHGVQTFTIQIEEV